MEKTIRRLYAEDFPFYEQMDTGLQEDYMLQAFERITTRKHHLYGLFLDEDLAAVGGFSVFADRYAMLGRLRSSAGHRGKGLASELMQHVAKEALRLEDIKWIGALTETHNTPAQRILEKLKMTHQATWYSAISDDVASLTDEKERWRQIDSLAEKRAWLESAYVRNGELFPYECYYPFPASWDLFPDEKLEAWDFFENSARTRFLIAKYDVKQAHYCHVVYPWDDFQGHPGFWETVQYAHKKLAERIDGKVSIWMDLTQKKVDALPASHPFQLPSVWMVYGRLK